MRAPHFFLTVSIMFVTLSSYVKAETFDLKLYNNLISQHLLTKSVSKGCVASYDGTTSAHASTSCASAPAAAEIVAWSKDIRMKRRGPAITIKQGDHQRSFCIGDCEVTRAWFYSCQEVGTLGKDKNGKLVMQDFRVCHLTDLESLDPQQCALFTRAKAVLQDGQTPIIANHSDHQIYRSLPIDLQKVFQISDDLLPQPTPPQKLSITTLAAFASMLLGGYMAIL